MPDPTRCISFDYACDDCVLPWEHYDPPQINEYIPNLDPAFDVFAGF